jgi:hypothetical protein
MAASRSHLDITVIRHAATTPASGHGKAGLRPDAISMVTLSAVALLWVPKTMPTGDIRG